MAEELFNPGEHVRIPGTTEFVGVLGDYLRDEYGNPPYVINEVVPTGKRGSDSTSCGVFTTIPKLDEREYFSHEAGVILVCGFECSAILHYDQAGRGGEPRGQR